MPQRRHHRGASQSPTKSTQQDPLTACLDANGTYICTAYNPRCYIIQKVTPTLGSAVLNPDADVFEAKQQLEGDVPWDTQVHTPEFTPLDGYVYMNGDIGKFPSGAVYPATPESLATPASTSTDYSSLNGVADPLEPYAQTSTVPGGSPADPNATGPDIPLDELKQMLSSQLEYYFSRENLANDAYLLSQMDNDQYVPIWTIANFNQVKKLTKDINLITEVLRESPNVQVDEEGIKVRPNHKRCIVILREIPDNTPLEEVKALFSGEGCPKLISCEFAHNNSWYVTFESDEDAQRAYRFLREEVREFQGKPIMARIKAKPMNRLPIPPVPPLGAAMKNGYRAPPAAVYDPNTYQNQQRFVYTNGSSIPPTVNYGNQVHVYTFQQQPPFYPPSMIQAAWTPASPAYFDIGSVFSVNGLAPQGSFSKPQNSRYVPRRNKRNQPMDRGSVADAGTGLSRQSYHVGVTTSVVGAGMVASKSANSNSASSKVVQPQQTQQTVQPSQTQTAQLQQQQQQQQQQPSANVDDHSKSHHTNTASVSQESSDAGGPGPSQNTSGSSLRSDGEDNSFRQSREALANKEPMPPRHRRRRKEDEVVGTGRQQTMKSMSGGSPQPLNRDIPGAKGVQFDLEATAFPPLPGLDGGSVVSAKSAPPVETVQIETSSSHWENRLSDVVKGTAKAKSTNTKEKESSGTISTSPRAASPASPSPKSVTTTPVSAGTAAVVPEVKVQQPPPPPPPLLPLPAQSTSQTLPTSSSVEKEVKDVGTNSDMGPSLVSQTPPSSPDKTVPVAKCMADKATKTDDTLLNGEMVGVSGIGKANEMGGSKQHLQQQQPAAASVSTSVSKPVPTTTNAATMTSAVVVTDVTPASVRIMVATTTNTSSAVAAAPAASNPAPSDSCPPVEAAGGPTRLSYAQVAQHTKEKVEKSARDKQSSAEQEKEKEKDRKKEMNTRIMQSHGDSREPPQREFREGPVRFMGRGGPRPVYDRERTDRGGIRRRDGPDRVPRFREFLRPRSPK